jgi:hypothetical protein
MYEYTSYNYSLKTSNLFNIAGGVNMPPTGYLLLSFSQLIRMI